MKTTKQCGIKVVKPYTSAIVIKEGSLKEDREEQSKQIGTGLAQIAVIS